MYSYFRMALLAIVIILILFVLFSWLKLHLLLKKPENQHRELHELEAQTKPLLKRISISAYIIAGSTVILIVADIFRGLLS